MSLVCSSRGFHRWCEFHRCCRGEVQCAPTVHLLRNSLRAAHELRWDFSGPCTQVQGRGSCPQGHGYHNSMQALAFVDKDIRHTPRSAPQQPQPQQPQNNTIWGGSVLTGEENPPHSGELKHALPQAGGPTQSQLSRPMSSGHHISMEHRLRRKQLNSDTNVSNQKYLKEIHEKKKRRNFFFWKNMKKKMINIKKSKNEEMNKK